MDQSTLAGMISSSRSNVANLFAVIESLARCANDVEVGDLEMGHARALLPLPESMQLKAAEDVLRSQLSVRQTETLVKRLLSQDSTGVRPCHKRPRCRSFRSNLVR